MSYVRSDGYSLKDPEDDAAFQVVIGDLQRLALNLYRGTPNAAYALTPKAAEDLNAANGQAPDNTENAGVDVAAFLLAANNLSDVASIPGSVYNLGVALAFGSYTKTTYSTPGSFTHTFAASSTRYIAIVASGGGGGGGGSASSSIGAIGPRGGGGGGAGGACLVSSKIISASLALTIGAAGTGGVTSGDGADGGASTLADGTTTVSPDPGTGGGGFGSNGGVGGAGDAAIIGASTIVLGFNGGSGQPGSVYTISTIAGVVQSYQVVRGLPGRSPLLSFGAGGYGEAPGNPTGSAGGAGGIYIWEA